MHQDLNLLYSKQTPVLIWIPSEQEFSYRTKHQWLTTRGAYQRVGTQPSSKAWPCRIKLHTHLLKPSFPEHRSYRLNHKQGNCSGSKIWPDVCFKIPHWAFSNSDPNPIPCHIALIQSSQGLSLVTKLSYIIQSYLYQPVAQWHVPRIAASKKIRFSTHLVSELSPNIIWAKSMV